MFYMEKDVIVIPRDKVFFTNKVSKIKFNINTISCNNFCSASGSADRVRDFKTRDTVFINAICNIFPYFIKY